MFRGYMKKDREDLFDTVSVANWNTTAEHRREVNLDSGVKAVL